MKVKMEFSKGIFFIRPEGSLTKYKVSEFKREVFPVILKHGFKYVVLNLENLNMIDTRGIECLLDLNKIISSLSGTASLCNLNNEFVKTYIENKNIYNYYFKTKDELSSIGVFKI